MWAAGIFPTALYTASRSLGACRLVVTNIRSGLNLCLNFSLDLGLTLTYKGQSSADGVPGGGEGVGRRQAAAGGHVTLGALGTAVHVVRAAHSLQSRRDFHNSIDRLDTILLKNTEN